MYVSSACSCELRENRKTMRWYKIERKKKEEGRRGVPSTRTKSKKVQIGRQADARSDGYDETRSWKVVQHALTVEYWSFL